MTNANFDTFLDAYLECLFWSSTNWETEDENFDDHCFDDLSAESMVEVVEECQNFFDTNSHAFKDQESQAGHDFCLTRNGHGAGFWDRPEMYDEDDAKTLTTASETYGTQGLYLGDDGQLYTHN